LRDAREIVVDRRGLLGAAGHAGDEQRSAQMAAEQAEGAVHLVDREIGERVVHEVDLLEQRRLARVLDRRSLAQLEVGALTLADALSQVRPRASSARTAKARRPSWRS